MSAKLVGLFAALGIVAVCAAGALRAQTNRPGETLQLWEYHTEMTRGPATAAPDQRSEPRRGAGTSDTMLNSRGREGWELVAVTRREIRVDDMMQTETSYVFKRPVRSINR
jgi:hypothetical protein